MSEVVILYMWLYEAILVYRHNFMEKIFWECTFYDLLACLLSRRALGQSENVKSFCLLMIDNMGYFIVSLEQKHQKKAMKLQKCSAD